MSDKHGVAGLALAGLALAGLALGQPSSSSATRPTRTAAVTAANPARIPDDRINCIIHVDPARGSDENGGSEEKPVLTLTFALALAKARAGDGEGSRIVLRPGIYRIGRLALSGQPQMDDPPLVIESSIPGAAIITGSESWPAETWRKDPGSGEWIHELTAAPKAVPGTMPMTRPSIHAAVVYVNQRPMAEAGAEGELTPGSYRLSRDGQTLHLKPPAELDAAKANIEVALEEPDRAVDALILAENRTTLAIRGVVFEHASPAVGGAALALIRCTNVLLEDCTFRDNGSVGLAAQETRALTARRVKFEANGGAGMSGPYHQDLLLEDVIATRNNWRKNSSVSQLCAGIRLMSAHGVTLRRVKATGNFSAGVRLQWNNRDVLIEDCMMGENRGMGLILEQSEGPTIIRNTIIAGNQRAGLLAAMARDLSLLDCKVYHNDDAEIFFGGGDDLREVEDWQTRQKQTVLTRNWTMTGNIISSDKSTSQPMKVDLPKGKWDEFATTLMADRNEYWSRDGKLIVLLREDRSLSFHEWREVTGQERNSRFNQPDMLALP